MEVSSVMNADLRLFMMFFVRVYLEQFSSS